ncbi:MAG TPA: P-loop NTPase fold protein [Longimicrobiaceae bacterium]|nr:P-loop NTPase fold protein [Longimicrobiaceae bacterium]
MRAQIVDAPVRDPDDDLLGTAPYARTLAEFIYTIEPPFTVGIYGEWGSGKTSFVNFVEHFLRQAPPGVPAARFVSFSAWPYRTADELWRALILAIARKLLLGDGEASPAGGDGGGPSAPARRSGFLEFLSRDALVLRAAPPETGPRAEYARLVARLDAMHGGVGKGSPPQVDPEQLGLTLANAAMAALSSMSPLAAAARKVLGMPSGVDMAKLIPRERNEATRDRIESMEEFRSAFRDLFDSTLKRDERVVVFIDDLDRCMPDAALDLLEAVKNFLGEVRCVFIVAADEQLIGQGLRLRYRDLVATEGSSAAEAFAQKGQEYFEKIIQLAIHVPQRTSEQTHNFIAAQFPQWLPATDVIQAAVGTNPRRLKQYCSWLQYRWMVSLTLPER